MMVTNLISNPRAHVTLKPGEYTPISTIEKTPGTTYWVTVWLDVSGGSITIDNCSGTFSKSHRMVLHVHDRESDEPEIQGRVRQSDRQGVEHGHVRAGRIPGEQGIARRPLLFRRGYDAARLTLMGVVA